MSYLFDFARKAPPGRADALQRGHPSESARIQILRTCSGCNNRTRRWLPGSRLWYANCALYRGQHLAEELVRSEQQSRRQPECGHVSGRLLRLRRWLCCACCCANAHPVDLLLYRGTPNTTPRRSDAPVANVELHAALGLTCMRRCEALSVRRANSDHSTG